MKIEEIFSKLHSAHENLIHKGVTWKHYKGGIYEVLGVVFDGKEVLVRHKRVAGKDYNYAAGEFYIEYVRPYKEWFEDVQPEPGIFVPRFRKVRKIERWHTDDEIEELRQEGPHL